MKMRLLGLAAIAAAALSSPAQAFPNDDITFLIPYNPGGGFDTLVRKVAPKMEEILGVEVVPTNMPGGSGRKAGGALMRAEPDGHTIMIFNIPGHGLAQVRGEEMPYDISALTWLGQVGQDGYVVMTAANHETIQSMDDILTLDRPLKIPEVGSNSTSFIANQITWSTLGVERTMISGYKSSRDYTTAVLRGDGDISMVVSGSAKRYNTAGDFNILAEFSPNQQFPDAPSGADLGKPELDGLGLRRVVAGPPGMPEDVVRILSDAIVAAVNDPEIQAWAAETGNPMPALNAAETSQAVAAEIDFYSRYKDMLQ